MAHNSGLTNAYCKAWFEDNQGNCTSPDTLSLGRFVPAPSPKKQKSGESLTLARSFRPASDPAQTNRSSSTTTSPRTEPEPSHATALFSYHPPSSTRARPATRLARHYLPSNTAFLLFLPSIPLASFSFCLVGSSGSLLCFHQGVLSLLFVRGRPLYQFGRSAEKSDCSGSIGCGLFFWLNVGDETLDGLPARVSMQLGARDRASPWQRSRGGVESDSRL